MEIRSRKTVRVLFTSMEPSDDDTETPQQQFGIEDRTLRASLDRISLETALQELSPGYRLVFLLHDVHGYEHQEIAEILSAASPEASPARSVKTAAKRGSLTTGATIPRRASVARFIAIAAAASGYTSVVDGRFKGGYITRRYGAPARGVHAIQLEMAQCVYMHEEPPYDYLPDRAARIVPHLTAMLDATLAFAEHR